MTTSVHHRYPAGPLRAALLASALLAVLCPTFAARADELSEEVDADEAVYAVQERPLVRGHEFSLSLGVLPLDSLYKGIIFGFGYTYHFNSALAWQIVHLRYSRNVDTGTVDELSQQFGVITSHTPQVSGLIDTNVLFKLLAGKMVLGQNRLAGAEVAAVLGPAVAVMSTSDVNFGFNVGLSFRAFLSRRFSASLDIREYELFQSVPFKVNNVLDISLVGSWHYNVR